MDNVRQQTDKLLSDLERRVEAIYASDPSLRRIRRKYEKYMENVKKITHASYLAFLNADDINDKKLLKNEYAGQIEAATVKNKRYRNIISEFTKIMAEINQKALDLVNAEMPEIYMLNYNQISADCRKLGIKVSDDKENIS